MYCVGLIVNQELILKRVLPRVIVNLNAELIHSLIKDVFGQKRERCIFQQVLIIFDLFWCLFVAKKKKKKGFDGLEALSGE